MPQTTYEVYAFDGTRWSLQQTFTGAQRERAMEEAQELYAMGHIKGVRVVQETYDAETGDTAEKTLLSRTKSDDVPKNLSKELKPKVEPPKTPPPAVKKAAPAAKPATAPKPAAAAKAPAPAASAISEAVAARTETTVVWARDNAGRLASVIASSGAVAIGGSILVTQLPADGPLLMAMKSVLGTKYVLMAGVAMFMIALAVFSAALVATGSQLAPRIAYEAAMAAPPSPTGGIRFPTIELEDDESVEAPSPGGLPAEGLRLIAFFHDCLVALPRDGAYMKDGKLDAYNWFGCHLFFAGLAADEGLRNHWTPLLTKQVIATAMTAALHDAKAAARFAARFEEYLTEPRSMEMFDRGRAAAARRTSQDDGAALALRLALEDWNRRPDQAASAGHIAVMFTDIVGSTEFTTIHGDAKHYEMVQAHDRIVRGALAEFSGREIKHTGDGIMAAFDDATLGVHAALRIQREIKAHREVAPDIAMRLRVGIAAGEPIRAGADLFGSTVQLAARICAIADGDQVAVTEPVREIASPAGFAFDDLGEQPVKGFKQPVRVHLVQA